MRYMGGNGWANGIEHFDKPTDGDTVIEVPDTYAGVSYETLEEAQDAIRRQWHEENVEMALGELQYDRATRDDILRSYGEAVLADVELTLERGGVYCVRDLGDEKPLTFNPFHALL